MEKISVDTNLSHEKDDFGVNGIYLMRGVPSRSSFPFPSAKVVGMSSRRFFYYY